LRKHAYECSRLQKIEEVTPETKLSLKQKVALLKGKGNVISSKKEGISLLLLSKILLSFKIFIINTHLQKGAIYSIRTTALTCSLIFVAVATTQGFLT